MKILQINTILNSGSTGRIAEEIGNTILINGEDSYVAYSRSGLPSKSISVQIGDKQDFFMHVLHTRLFDNHGFSSKKSTNRFIEEIEVIDPDVIHLHNIHGYYLHIGLLVDFLKKKRIPIVWTFHDCWPFTGHCTYFDSVNCEKWRTGCFACPKTKKYPQSWFIDNSKNNYNAKKKLFQGFEKLQIVTPSQWLKKVVEDSFLKEYPISVINNGVDLDVFNPEIKVTSSQISALKNKKIILGVASIWDQRKGLQDFIQISGKLDLSFQIVLIGLSAKQIKSLPKNIIGISRTENTNELAAWYEAASVFLNPTYQDNFPTTNVEALACGTPLITYKTGGSPEAIDVNTGMVVEKGDKEGLLNAILELDQKDQNQVRGNCRDRAEELFDMNKRYQDYIDLYHKMI